MAHQRRSAGLPLAMLLGLAALGSAAASAAGSSAPGTVSLQARAITFVHTLAGEHFKTAEASFTGQMQRALPQATLSSTWQEVTAKLGAFQRTGKTRTLSKGPYTVVIVKSVFQRRTVGISVTFNAAKQIAGMFFGPPP